jgi:hypothetical protein
MRAAIAAAEPDDDPPGVRACLPQRPDRGVVALRKIALERRAVHLGRHVLRFEQVLDRDRHAVDRRERLARLPALAARVGCCARDLVIEVRERLHDRLARGDRLDCALEVGARGIGAVAELRQGIVERQRSEGMGVIHGWSPVQSSR